MTAGWVELDRVWKKFHYGEVHTRLRDAIPALVRRGLGQNRPEEGLWKGEFWALQDVSFSVAPGEAIGIIGPNGAGKSTVLKLLIGIMRPTAGSCLLRGRVGALIEVAAGFHPDLTGRENVYLQGVIMGMPRREITRKFDQIVEFAEVAPFIDTPVKRYSSGMQARLGFAIAAHLDPDVLVVDEGLAVGDAAFQTKAFVRVTELVQRDIPVILVSHELDAIMALCTGAILLDRGRVVRAGNPKECVAAYRQGIAGLALPPAPEGAIRIDRLDLPDSAVSGRSISVDVACQIRAGQGSAPESVRLRIRAAHGGYTMVELDSQDLGASLPVEGSFRLSLELQMNLPAGMYLVETLAWNRTLARECFTGPSTYLEIKGGAPFEGAVQTNPRVEVHGPSTRRKQSAPNR